MFTSAGGGTFRSGVGPSIPERVCFFETSCNFWMRSLCRVGSQLLLEFVINLCSAPICIILYVRNLLMSLISLLIACLLNCPSYKSSLVIMHRPRIQDASANPDIYSGKTNHADRHIPTCDGWCDGLCDGWFGGQQSFTIIFMWYHQNTLEYLHTYDRVLNPL